MSARENPLIATYIQFKVFFNMIVCRTDSCLFFPSLFRLNERNGVYSVGCNKSFIIITKMIQIENKLRLPIKNLP